MGLSPASVSYGTVGRGASADQSTTLYNIGNASALNYAIRFTNDTQLSATPSSGVIGPKQNATILIHLNVPINAANGSYTSLMVVNGTVAQNFGGSAVVPQIAGKVAYSISGTTTPPQASNGTNWLITGSIAALCILAAVIVVSVYITIKRRS